MEENSKAYDDTENASTSKGYSKESDPDDLLMCRVCRGNEGSLYYPCLCTGSIKYVHQECLVEWLKYSKKEVCELCNYKYSFHPIYRQDMPSSLPIVDIVKGIAVTVGGMLKTWVIYTLVMMAWVGLVPLTAARIYNCIFYLSIQDIMATPVHLFKIEHIANDIFKGSILLVVFVCAFISLVWLREQIILGGPEYFLRIDGTEDDDENAQNDGEDEEESEEDEEDDEMDYDGDEIEEGNLRDPNDLRDGAGFEEDSEEENANRVRIADEEVRNILGGDQRQFGEMYDDMRDDGNEIVENDPGRIRPAEPEPIQGAQPAPRRRNRARNREPDQDADDNWRDWDRFGEELTWQRLLGLDGSLVFLEHVFWVISLNTLFTVMFAYVPYRFGNYILILMNLQSKISYYPSIVSMLIGYVFIASIIYTIHMIVGFFKMKTLYRFLGVSFLIIKVFLLVLMEIGLFPVMCGCWMDICTLPLLSATLSQRIATFSASPFMSLFLHWMFGMIYVFYSASFVILLREILRPGVLWFMRNLNDPEFNPIQEMIDLPFTRHMRRLVVSTTLFFSTILLIFYIPLNLINKVFPNVLPYNISKSADTPMSEMSLELLILQIVMPAILEHANGRAIIKLGVKQWCKCVGKVLKLDRYLLSDTQSNENAPPHPAPAGAGNGGGLGAEHQALLLLREPISFEPYERPSYFAIRIAVLIVLMSITTVVSSAMFFVVPTSLGRFLIYSFTEQRNVHEMYTISLGLYICWAIGKTAHIIYKFTNNGSESMKQVLIRYAYLGIRLLSVTVPVVFLLPLLVGSYFQLVFIAPFRLSLEQSAMSFPYQDWAMGVVQLKIFAVAAMMGPDWWLKSEMELVIQRGIDNFAAVYILMRIVLPLTLYLGSFIAFPVLLVKVYSYLMGLNSEMSMLLLRYMYPGILCCTVVVLLARWQARKLSALAEKIKNDRYLVGTQLVNYERNGKK